MGISDDELDERDWMRSQKEIERGPYIRNPGVKGLI